MATPLPASQLRPYPDFSRAVSVDPAPSRTALPTIGCLKSGLQPQAPPPPEAPPLGSTCFSPPWHPQRPQRWPRCAELGEMGLPEERRKSGSGSRAREETGAEGRVRGWSPPPEVRRSAHVSSLQRYRELHRRSVEEPRGEAGPGRLLGAPVSRAAGLRGTLTELPVRSRQRLTERERWKRD